MSNSLLLGLTLASSPTPQEYNSPANIDLQQPDYGIDLRGHFRVQHVSDENREDVFNDTLVMGRLLRSAVEEIALECEPAEELLIPLATRPEDLLWNRHFPSYTILMDESEYSTRGHIVAGAYSQSLDSTYMQGVYFPEGTREKCGGTINTALQPVNELVTGAYEHYLKSCEVIWVVQEGGYLSGVPINGSVGIPTVNCPFQLEDLKE